MATPNRRRDTARNVGRVEIICGDHEVGPQKVNLPFVIVDGRGLHISLIGVGTL